MSRRRIAVAALLVGPFVAACAPPAPEVVVYAAASTAPVVEPLARRHTEATGVPVRCNFAASATLARQIELGARADVFLSASPEWMDHLEQRGRLTGGSRQTLVSNRLVLVVPAGGRPDPVDLVGRFPSQRFPRFATADPDFAPLGAYARSALTALGWWADASPKLIRALDARAALRLVELGEVDGAIVYASDAVTSPRVAVVAIIPDTLHPPVTYPLALTGDASPEAAAFVARLRSADAAARFRAAGFTPIPAEVPDAQ